MGNQFQKSDFIEHYSSKTPVPDLSSPQLREDQIQKVNEPSPQIQRILQQKDQEYISKVPKSEYKILNSGIYQGYCNPQGHPVGYGKFMKNDGSMLIGQYEDGKLSGNGLIIYKDGSYYDGDVVKNQISGKGIFKRGFYTYEGDWLNNKYEGYGKQSNADPNNFYTFQGKFKHGSRREGQLRWKAGQQNFGYVGQFNQNNQFQGQGSLQSQKGVYKGHFRDGLKHGRGQFLFTHGVLYQGTYNHGIKQGEGVLYHNLGEQVSQKDMETLKKQKDLAHRGNFRDNIPDGKGEYFNSRTQEIEACSWIDGQKIVSRSKIHF